MYGPVYVQFYYFLPYSDTLSDIYETNINKNLRFCHGYKRCSGNKQLITKVSKTLRKCFIKFFQNNKLSLPAPGQLSVILMIKMLYKMIYWNMEEIFMNKQILGFQVQFFKTEFTMI